MSLNDLALSYRAAIERPYPEIPSSRDDGQARRDRDAAREAAYRERRVIESDIAAEPCPACGVRGRFVFGDWPCACIVCMCGTTAVLCPEHFMENGNS